MGLNLVGEAGWVDRGEDPGPADQAPGLVRVEPYARVEGCDPH